MIESIRAHFRMGAGLYAQMAEELAETTARAAELLIETVRAGHRIYVCGDGGSAAQAQHIAGELIGRFLKDRGPLPCVALTTDTSVLTAVANDYEFESVFARQVEALAGEGDLLWALSTSGNSANVLKAASAASRRGARLLGMTGRDGGHLKELCDVTLCVPADSSPPIQEGHLALVHILCGLVEQALFAEGESQT